jgi:hypothetical protein
MPEITRTIQWYGLIRFPPNADLDKIAWWRLTADMVRRPIAEFRSDGVWQPPRGFWGNVVSRRDRRRLDNWQLEFQNQIVAEYSATEAFLHTSISCSLDATLKSIENLATSLGFLTVRFNPIKEWKPYRLIPEEFSVKMQSDNAVGEFLLEWDYLETCNIDNNEPPPPPPPPPPIRFPIPLDPTSPNPRPISPPYNEPNDFDETYVPEDQEEPEDPPDQEITYLVIVNGTREQLLFTGFWEEVGTGEIRIPVQGPIRNVTIVPRATASNSPCNTNSIDYFLVIDSAEGVNETSLDQEYNCGPFVGGNRNIRYTIRLIPQETPEE